MVINTLSGKNKKSNISPVSPVSLVSNIPEDPRYPNLNRIKKLNQRKIIDGPIVPYFENLEKHLISHIESASYIIGCIAWLTNENVITALSQKRGIKIIVNKEEFLNPEMEISQRFFYQILHNKYNNLPNIFESECLCCQKKMTLCPKFKNIFGEISPSDNNCSAILTCGIVNSLPKMHHKFLIFLDDQLNMTGVWTGSYNLSRTSNFSLENALYIVKQDVIAEYLKEFIVIFQHSENYYWKSGLLSPIS